MSVALAIPAQPPSGRHHQRLVMALRVAASVALHAALLVVLLLKAQAPLHAPQQRSIAVELVSAAPVFAKPATPVLTAPAAKLQVQQSAPVPVKAPAPTTQAPASSGMIRATHLMAAAVLAEPASKSVRETLPLLASDERMTQLCDIEALEQLRVWKTGLEPDTIVDYAMADAQVSGQTITANGAAFRSKRQWYQVKFECAVARDYQSVTDFQFKVGDLIPQGEWESHYLNAEDLDD